MVHLRCYLGVSSGLKLPQSENLLVGQVTYYKKLTKSGETDVLHFMVHLGKDQG